jgi:energy-coupling factor transporter ATP-binding protein EcfA2
MKTGPVRQNNVAAYRLTEEIRQLFGFDRLEINPSDDNQTLQVFINGRSYRLPELGSGMAQFILVLANAAVRRPALILIDEPELNLHPSLQLDFLTTIGSYASVGLLFATHSMGLARSGADYIYSLRRLAEGESEVREFEATPNLSEFLGELSFSGYQELGYKKVLLVEGTTDVKVIQHFLRLYDKEHQIVLLPLGGRQLINKEAKAQLHEIKRITPNIYALIDSEREEAGAALDPVRQGFVDACAKAAVVCHVLERRAIENYFSEEAVKKVKGAKYHALGPHEALTKVQPSWAKAENWRMAREMTRQEIAGSDLGQFLQTL